MTHFKKIWIVFIVVAIAIIFFTDRLIKADSQYNYIKHIHDEEQRIKEVDEVIERAHEDVQNIDLIKQHYEAKRDSLDQLKHATKQTGVQLRALRNIVGQKSYIEPQINDIVMDPNETQVAEIENDRKIERMSQTIKTYQDSITNLHSILSKEKVEQLDTLSHNIDSLKIKTGRKKFLGIF